MDHQLSNIKLKVCGMRDQNNIRQVAALAPDYLGFIFYPPSSRYVLGDLKGSWLNTQPINAKKVGVFVDATTDIMLKYAKEFGLDILQLHGKENPKQCAELKAFGVEIIKVFSVGLQFDFHVLEPYKPSCDFFLFDTKGKLPGGNGVTFNWEILQKYDNEVPFFLSGGVSIENISRLNELAGLNIHAVDVNSKFEIKPALKDVEMLKNLKKLLEA